MTASQNPSLECDIASLTAHARASASHTRQWVQAVLSVARYAYVIAPAVRHGTPVLRIVTPAGESIVLTARVLAAMEHEGLSFYGVSGVRLVPVGSAGQQDAPISTLDIRVIPPTGVERTHFVRLHGRLTAADGRVLIVTRTKPWRCLGLADARPSHDFPADSI